MSNRTFIVRDTQGYIVDDFKSYNEAFEFVYSKRVYGKWKIESKSI